MIISKYVDSEAMDIEEIIDNFNEYLEMADGSALTPEQSKLIKKLCEKYPVLRIMCRAMHYAGYESF